MVEHSRQNVFAGLDATAKYDESEFFSGSCPNGNVPCYNV